MLELYDYLGNKKVILKSSNQNIAGEAYNILNESEINGQKELSFILPLYVVIDGIEEENYRWEYVQNELLIKYINKKNQEDWYIIKSTEDIHDDSGVLKSNIQAKHISYNLNKRGLEKSFDTTDNANNLMTEVLKNTGWTVGVVDDFKDKDNNTKIRTLRLDSKSNTMEQLQKLAELFEGFLKFNSDKTVDLRNEIGQDNSVVFRYRKNIKNVSRIINSEDLVTRLYCEGGDDEAGIVLINDVNPTKELFIDNFSYYINSGLMPIDKVAKIDVYEQDILNINTQINDIQSQIDTKQLAIVNKQGEIGAKKIRKQSLQQLVQEIDDKLPIALESEKTNLLNEKTNYIGQINTLIDEIANLETEITNNENEIDTLTITLNDYLSQKNSIESQYKIDLNDYIHEGLFSDSMYVDSQSLYNDGLSTLEKICVPKVEYQLDIVDLSTLTGYEIESFSLGDIVTVYDELLKLDTKARITRISFDEDEPWKTKIEISNFNSSFDSLFKDISKSVEILQQKKEIWARVEKGLNPDGTIGKQMLQKTFDQNLFSIISGTNNSVIYDNNGITVKDLNDTLKMVRINAGIISMTEDGGVTWNVAMNAKGLNFKYAIGGRLDINEVAIYGDGNFYWNSRGLYAINPLNTNQWIKFNKDGLYATLDNGVSSVFSLTWAGLTIGKDSVEGLDDIENLAVNSVQLNSFYNAVKISQQNGIQVYDNQTIPVDRVKIGDLGMVIME